MLKFLVVFDLCIMIAFVLCCARRFAYLILSLLRQLPKYPVAPHTHRYAILIQTHNGDKSIVPLLDSIRHQTYPTEYITVFVCTDGGRNDTAHLSHVYGAHAPGQLKGAPAGEGHALGELVDYVLKRDENYDALLFLDADSILSPDYLTEMDNCFSAGHRVVSGYQNTGNFGMNWISSGYGVWFLHESAQQNCGRNLCGVSAGISGTGYLVARNVFCGGSDWYQTGQTEDVQFMAELLLRGEPVAFCPSAVLYSKQPDTFSDFWHRQLHRCLEHRQVMTQYGPRLLRKALDGDRSCTDFLTSIAPYYLLSTLTITVHAVLWLLSFIHDLLLPLWPSLVESPHSTLPGPIYPLTPHVTMALLFSLLLMAAIVWLILFPVGLSVVMTEQKRIHATFRKKIAMTFTFPLFILALIFIFPVSLFRLAGVKAGGAGYRTAEGWEKGR